MPIKRVDPVVWETHNLEKDETWLPNNIPQFSSIIFMLIFHPLIVGISKKLKHESCRIFSVDIKKKLCPFFRQLSKMDENKQVIPLHEIQKYVFKYISYTCKLSMEVRNLLLTSCMTTT